MRSVPAAIDEDRRGAGRFWQTRPARSVSFTRVSSRGCDVGQLQRSPLRIFAHVAVRNQSGARARLREALHAAIARVAQTVLENPPKGATAAISPLLSIILLSDRVVGVRPLVTEVLLLLVVVVFIVVIVVVVVVLVVAAAADCRVHPSMTV